MSSPEFAELKTIDDGNPFQSFKTVLEATGSDIGFADTVQNRIHRRLRICIATRHFVGLSRPSGAAVADTAMSEALAAHPAFDVTVLYLKGNTVPKDTMDDWTEEYRKRNIRLIALPESSTGITADSMYLLNAYQTFQYLLDHEQEFDLIRFHEARGSAYFVTTAKRQGIAFQNTLVLSTIHCPTSFSLAGSQLFTQSTEEVYSQYLEKISTSQSDVVVSPSRYMLDWIRREHQWKLPPKTFVQQNILSDVVLQLVPREKTQKSKVATFVEEFVFYGRLNPLKGVFVFADALDILAPLVTEGALRLFSVTFLGGLALEYGQNAESVLRERAKKGAWPFSLRFLTNCMQAEAISYLRAEPGRIALLPTLLDNSPYSVMECIALQIPLLASNVGGISELIHADDQSHVLFRPQPQSLADRLIDAVLHGVRVVRPSIDAFANGPLAQDFHAQLLVDFIENPQERVGVSIDDKLVSIFVLYHNHKLQIIPTIQSLLQQTHANMELIIVDDGSEEEGLRFLQKVSASIKDNPRIVNFELLLTNGEMAPSTIVSKARGSFVAFIDAGDVPVNHWIEDLLFVQAQTQADVVMPMLNIYNDDEGPKRFELLVPIGPSVSAGMFHDIGPYCALWQKSSLDALQWDKVETGTFEDPALMVRALLKGTGYRIELLPRPLVFFRKRKANRANAFARRQRILKEYLDVVPKDLADALTFAYAKANKGE